MVCGLAAVTIFRIKAPSPAVEAIALRGAIEGACLAGRSKGIVELSIAENRRRLECVARGLFV